MATRKAKKQSKQPAARSAKSRAGVKVPRIAVGAKVRVRHGVWGNSTGTVAGLSSAGVLVRLDSARAMDPLPFDAENLVEGGPMDRF
jgi:hypothetical protein